MGVESQPSPSTSAPATKQVRKEDSYVKLAMRNMVRKGSTSLKHFGLTVLGLLAALVGLAALFH